MAYNGAVGILDFQDARMGPQPYDLASLLTDRGTPDLLGNAVLAALSDYYVRRFEVAAGCRIDRDAFDQLFDYVALQRCLKATGTFAAMAVIRQRPSTCPTFHLRSPTSNHCCNATQRYSHLPYSYVVTCRISRSEA